MKTFVECAAPQDTSGQVLYRFACRCCPLHGEWRNWLSEAERDGAVHERRDHGEGRVCA